MKRLSFMVAAFLVLCVCASPLYAGDLDGYTVVPVSNGVNKLTLDGHEAMAVRAWRENFNAHGFDVVTFYFRDRSDDGKTTWNLVPVFDQDDSRERDMLTVSGGADCQLHDFRLLQADGRRPVRLVLADRDMGDSYADGATVHFSYYELARNEDDSPGRPTLYFKAWKTTVAAHKYCDVNEALDKELHLGASSGASD
jgi:hypothetical protein